MFFLQIHVFCFNESNLVSLDVVLPVRMPVPHFFYILVCQRESVVDLILGREAVDQSPHKVYTVPIGRLEVPFEVIFVAAIRFVLNRPWSRKLP